MGDATFTVLATGGAVVGTSLLVLTRWLSRRGARSVLGRIGIACLLLLGTGAGALGLAAGWARLRPQPEPTTRRLRPGLEYRRVVRDSPRPMVVHVLDVDLAAVAWTPVVTAAEADGTFRARTVSSFVEATGVAFGVNTHYYYRADPSLPRDEDPREGEPVRALGRSARLGRWQQPQPWHGATIYVDAQGRASVTEPARLEAAFSGNRVLVRDGGATPEAVAGELAPRLGVGLAEGGARMIFVLVDGRQPGYSEGSTLRELAETLIELGATDAVELDGGGSATMVARDPDGDPEVLNVPIHTRIPGRQRPVAAHFGLRAVD